MLQIMWHFKLLSEEILPFILDEQTATTDEKNIDIVESKQVEVKLGTLKRYRMTFSPFYMLNAGFAVFLFLGFLFQMYMFMKFYFFHRLRAYSALQKDESYNYNLIDTQNGFSSKMASEVSFRYTSCNRFNLIIIYCVSTVYRYYCHDLSWYSQQLTY